jgi:hypothetical protein
LRICKKREEVGNNLQISKNTSKFGTTEPDNWASEKKDEMGFFHGYGLSELRQADVNLWKDEDM